MVALECNVHGWMHASLGVLPHPFFGVSGGDGSFALKGLPPGTYTIEAWHEKYGTQTATGTVAGSETKTADFSFAAKGTNRGESPLPWWVAAHGSAFAGGGDG